MKIKHYYEGQGADCIHKDEITGDVCGLRKKHIIHKVPKPHYQEGEVVGKYVVAKDGSFRAIKEA